MHYFFNYIKIILIIYIVALLGNPTFAESTKPQIDVTIDQEYQEFNLAQTLYVGFDPDPLVVQKDLLLKIYATTDKREHINRLSILPWITSSDLLEPGKTTLIEFTPDEAGEFSIRNIGHGFTGVLEVVESTASISSSTESQQSTTSTDTSQPTGSVSSSTESQQSTTGTDATQPTTSVSNPVESQQFTSPSIAMTDSASGTESAATWDFKIGFVGATVIATLKGFRRKRSG
ncbi:MAG: hypothetical protein IH840_02420 [Candidatus Heimdallarchaeota archaeon]|nr:hypothetical protein [Candidatus Heimdallarchaeota archaeon]